MAREEGQRMHESLTKYTTARPQIAGKRSFTPHYQNVPPFRKNLYCQIIVQSMITLFKDLLAQEGDKSARVYEGSNNLKHYRLGGAM